MPVRPRRARRPERPALRGCRRLPFAGRCSSFFFVVPLVLILVGELLATTTTTRSSPASPSRTTSTIFAGCGDLAGALRDAQDLSVDAEVLPARAGLITLVLGFAVAYFLAFHVRSPDVQTRCS